MTDDYFDQRLEMYPYHVLFISFFVFLILSFEKIYLGYDFLFANIQGTLDSAQYWRMAEGILDGREHDLRQWWLWSVGFPIVLSKIIFYSRALDFDPLVSVHFLFTLSHALSVIPMYWFARSVCPGFKTALAATCVYALAVPLLWLNLFVMSENLSIPFLVLGFGIISRGFGFAFSSLAGLSIGFAVFMRPSLGPVAGVVFLLILILPSYSFRSKLIQSLIFSFCFLFFVGLAIFLERSVTSDRVTGISPNAGIAFALGMCRPAGYAFICPDCQESGNSCPMVDTPWPEGATYTYRSMTLDQFNDSGSCVFTKGGSSSAAKIEGVGEYLIFKTPPWDSKPISDASSSCLDKLSTSDLLSLYQLNFTMLFASVDNLYVKGITSTQQVVMALAQIASIIVLLFFAVIQLLMREKVSFKHYILFVAVLIPLVMSLFFVSVLRYVYPFIFILSALSFSSVIKSSISLRR